MERITSRENQWIKKYIRLSDSKKDRIQAGQIVFESPKLVKEAFLSGLEFEMVFVTEACFQKNKQELEKLFQKFPGVFLSEELEKKLSPTKSPQGIYAIAVKPDPVLNLQKIVSGGKYILLAGLQDTGNVGTIIRNAEAMGISGILLGENTCDPFSPKVIRGSMGSVFRMPMLQFDDLLSTVIYMNENGVQTIAGVVDPSAVSLETFSFADPAILFIGNEGNGLKQELIDACKESVTIQMRGNTESLNASMAAGIFMWEMMK